MVSFNLPPATNESESDYYEEPDTPQRPEPLKPSRKTNAPLTLRKDAVSSLNDLNELPTRLKTAKDYMNAWCSPEAGVYFANLR